MSLRIIYLRGLLAFTVAGVTWWLALKGSGIASEWEAVFLVVVGYYFNDRTFEDAFTSYETGVSWANPAAVEILVQFLLAWSMVAGTLLIFVYPSFKDSASGVWIGAVVLAVGFYFKESKVQLLRRMNHVVRATLAITVTILTVTIFIHGVTIIGSLPWSTCA